MKPRKMQALTALLRGESIVKAAAAKVSTMTLHRWRQEPEFQAAYKEGIRKVFGLSIDRLQAVTGKAVRTLVKSLNTSKVADKIKAADRLLSHALRAAELRDLAERVEQLEQALKDREGEQ